MEYAIAAAVIAIAAAINRFRGMGISGSRVYASIAFGLLTGLYLWDWMWGLAAGLAFLFWGSMSWGRWFDLGRLPDDWNRDPNKKSAFDSAIEAVSFDSDHVAFFLRHVIGILPLGLALGWFCGWEWLASIPLFAAGAVAAYEISHQFFDAKAGEDFVPLGEILTGVVWGILLVLVAYLCKGMPWLLTSTA